MLNNITLGQYFPAESPLHKLDARIKIILVFVYLIGVFLIQNFIGYGFLAIFTFAIIAISKVPFKMVIKSVKPLLFFIIFTAILNIFMTDGKVIWSFYFLKITDMGLIYAAKMILRIFFLVLGTSMLTYTTSPIQLTDGIERLLKPFSRFGFPAHELAMIMSIALRFIPILLEETDKIMKAQMARGADFESGNIIHRAKALIPLLVPLFISAFRRADELAAAMEARCYHGGEGRTRMKISKVEKRDYIAIGVFFIFIAGVVFLNEYSFNFTV